MKPVLVLSMVAMGAAGIDATYPVVFRHTTICKWRIDGWPTSSEVGNTNCTSGFVSPTAKAMGHPNRCGHAGLPPWAIVCRLSEAAFAATSAPASTRAAVRFAAVDVYIDTQDQPLAAYQFELAAETGEVSIVGIEGGEHPAFREPPYYDPAALSRNRVIIAALNTGQDLPQGQTRVARVHVQIRGEDDPDYVANLVVAASGDGVEFPATIKLAQGVAN